MNSGSVHYLGIRVTRKREGMASTLWRYMERRKRSYQAFADAAENIPKQAPLNQPRSLQQICILFTVTNLEVFPPNVLALLPLKFKRELLLLLPPADIFQLEQTGFVDGIDMENEVWKVVYERYDFKAALHAHIGIVETQNYFYPSFKRYRPFDQPSFPKVIELRDRAIISSWRATFLSFLFALLLHMQPFLFYFDLENLHLNYTSAVYRNFVVFLQLLFSTKFHKLNQICTHKGFPLQVFDTQLVVPRYSTYYQYKSLPLTWWIRYLLTTLHQPPPRDITIEERFFTLYDSAIITDKSSPLQGLFSEVENLSLHLVFENTPQVSTVSTSLGPTFSHSFDSTLQTLSIQKVVWLIDTICDSTRALMNSFELTEYVESHVGVSKIIDKHKFDSVIQKFFMPSTILSCLQSLQNIHIVGNNLQNIEVTLLGFSSIFSVLSSPVLKTLNVSFVVIRNIVIEHKIYEEKVKSKYPLSLSSTCTTIDLAHISKLPISIFNWLLHLFVHSSSTSPQTLTVSHCVLDYTIAIKRSHFIPSHTPNFEVPYKSLQLSRLNLAPDFLFTISSLQTLVLENLKLEEFTEYWTDEVGPMELFHASFFDKPKCIIKSFTYNIEISWRESKSLNSKEEMEIEAVFMFLRRFPKTELTLRCTVPSDQAHPLFNCLVKNWRKTHCEGNCKLEKLIVGIVITGTSLMETHRSKSHLYSLASIHQVNMVTKSFEIGMF